MRNQRAAVNRLNQLSGVSALLFIMGVLLHGLPEFVLGNPNTVPQIVRIAASTSLTLSMVGNLILLINIRDSTARQLHTRSDSLIWKVKNLTISAAFLILSLSKFFLSQPSIRIGLAGTGIGLIFLSLGIIVWGLRSA